MPADFADAIDNVLSEEQVEDYAATLFTAGGHTGISFAYNDASNRIEATLSGGNNNYTTNIGFTGTTTKILTLSRLGLIDITASFSDLNNIYTGSNGVHLVSADFQLNLTGLSQETTPTLTDYIAIVDTEESNNENKVLLSDLDNILQPTWANVQGKTSLNQSGGNVTGSIDLTNNTFTLTASGGGASDGNGIYTGSGTTNGAIVTVGTSDIEFFGTSATSSVFLFNNIYVRSTTVGEAFFSNQSSISTPTGTTTGIDYIGYRGTTSALMNDNTTIVRGETALIIAPPNHASAATGSVLTKQADGNTLWAAPSGGGSTYTGSNGIGLVGLDFRLTVDLLDNETAPVEGDYILLFDISENTENKVLISAVDDIMKPTWGNIQGKTTISQSGGNVTGSIDLANNTFALTATGTTTTWTATGDTGSQTISNANTVFFDMDTYGTTSVTAINATTRSVFFDINEAALKTYTRAETHVDINDTDISISTQLASYDKVFVSVITSSSATSNSIVILPAASSTYHKKEIIITSWDTSTSYGCRIDSSIDLFVDNTTVGNYVLTAGKTVRLVCQKYPAGSTTYYWAIQN
jgi:hypothetical protein